MVFLHNRETQLAIDTLKMLENRDTKANSAAVTMLSFIYYLVSKIYEYVLYFIYFAYLNAKIFSKEIMIKRKSMVKQLATRILTMHQLMLIYPLVRLEKRSLILLENYYCAH